MATLVIPNAALLILHWLYEGVPGTNVLGANAPAPINVTQGLVDTLAAAIKAALGTSGLGALLTTDVSLSQVGLRNINVANQAEVRDSGAAVAGTGTGNTLPQNVAAVVTLRTALAGASFRGRVYFGGFAVTNTTVSGVIPDPVAVSTRVFVSSIRDALTSNGMALAVLSRPQDAVAATTIIVPAKPAKLGFATPVTTIETRDNRWDSQRRRLD